MANSFFIKSNLGHSLVIDVQGAIDKAGTLLDSYPQKLTSNKNQLWSFVRGPASQPGSFFIQSQMSKKLVIDIQGAKTKPGTPLDAWTKKSRNNKNQLWRSVPGPFNSPYYFFLQSLLGDLVIDVYGARTEKDTPLDAWTMKSKNHRNQLWTLESAPGNVIEPYITKVVPDAAYTGIIVSGKGFFPLFPLWYSYQYLSSDGGDSFTGSPQFMNTWADFAGNFSGYIAISSPDNLSPTTTGNLTLTLQGQHPSASNYFIGAFWNGTKFKINTRSGS
jgi:Ricin-type beta-trefoil lectin domain-like